MSSVPKAFEKLLNDYFNQFFTSHPADATYVGLTSGEGQFNTATLPALRRQHRLRQAALAKLDTIAPSALSNEQNLDRLAFRARLLPLVTHGDAIGDGVVECGAHEEVRQHLPVVVVERLLARCELADVVKGDGAVLGPRFKHQSGELISTLAAMEILPESWPFSIELSDGSMVEIDETMASIVEVDEETAHWALVALQRMLEVH